MATSESQELQNFPLLVVAVASLEWFSILPEIHLGDEENEHVRLDLSLICEAMRLRNNPAAFDTTWQDLAMLCQRPRVHLGNVRSNCALTR